MIGKYTDFSPYSPDDERRITWANLRALPQDALPPWADRFAADAAELARKAEAR